MLLSTLIFNKTIEVCTAHVAIKNFNLKKYIYMNSINNLYLCRRYNIIIYYARNIIYVFSINELSIFRQHYTCVHCVIHADYSHFTRCFRITIIIPQYAHIGHDVCGIRRPAHIIYLYINNIISINLLYLLS